MRLDIYLVKTGYFSSRNRAKNAIKRGFVLVNGEVVKKPSKQLIGSEKIEVVQPERPEGYWKLMKIDEKFNLLKKNYFVLDVGSSAGGFLIYSAERCKRVLGVEFSREFLPQLSAIAKEFSNVDVVIADIFSFNVKTEFDLALVDLSLDINSALKAVKRVYKFSEKIMFVAKGVKLNEIDVEKPLRVINAMQSKKREVYLLLE